MANGYASAKRQPSASGGLQWRKLKRAWPAYAVPVWLAIIFFLGGGSRHDIESLAILRSLAVLVIAIAIWFSNRQTYRDVRWPLILLLTLGALMVAQLAPLPPSVWSSLPGRDLIYELSVLAGLGELWRPLTFSPVKTANSLATLAVPLSVLLLYSLLPASRRDIIWPTLVGLGVFSALIGVAQVTLRHEPLFFYDITNFGQAVGLFANRNHNAVFLACATLISLYLAAAHLEAGSKPRVLVFSAAALILAAAVLTNGSRAGLLSLVVVWAISLLAILAGFPSIGTRGSGASRRKRHTVLAGLFVSGVGLATLFIFAGRSAAVARLTSGGQLEELRAQLLPVLVKMAEEFQPLGTGFGAFEYAYRTVEPVSLLDPAYLNNAHNDWLQFAIEGGVPALVVLAGGLIAAAARVAVLATRARSNRSCADREAWLSLGLLLILAAASVVDYPLRVPSLMAVGILALAKFANPGVGTRSDG